MYVECYVQDPKNLAYIIPKYGRKIQKTYKLMDAIKQDACFASIQKTTQLLHKHHFSGVVWMYQNHKKK